MYSSAIVNENYLRGVAVTDAAGQVTFTTIFPACYSGRWPHIHFEVYPTLASATNGANKIATSQLALPKASCDQVYASSGYSSSAGNLSCWPTAADWQRLRSSLRGKLEEPQEFLRNFVATDQRLRDHPQSISFPDSRSAGHVEIGAI